MIDLQSHSTVSDGQLEPGDVARTAAEAGVTVMSLTDHDGVAGVEEASRVASELGIENVPATEMSCVHKYSEDLHICGYWVDLERIAPACAKAQQERVDRAKEIIANLNRHGVEVTFEDAVAKAGAADAIGRPHIAKAAGAGPDLGPFFEEYLVPGAKAFVSRKWPTPSRRSSSSTTPAASRWSPTPTGTSRTPTRSATSSRAWSRDVGLDGIEAFYPPHTPGNAAPASSSARSSISSRRRHRTSTARPTIFSRWVAYHTYDLGEPQVRTALTPAPGRNSYDTHGSEEPRVPVKPWTPQSR